jgi:hypothetical protein
MGVYLQYGYSQDKNAPDKTKDTNQDTNQDDENFAGDLATTTGWGLFVRWVDSLDDAPALRQLTDFGYSENVSGILSEIVSKTKMSPPGGSPGDTLEELLELLQERPEGCDLIYVIASH